MAEALGNVGTCTSHTSGRGLGDRRTGDGVVSLWGRVTLWAALLVGPCLSAGSKVLGRCRSLHPGFTRGETEDRAQVHFPHTCTCREHRRKPPWSFRWMPGSFSQHLRFPRQEGWLLEGG